MARFFKPLLGAVALAAAALTSTGALAAYNYNAQITITAPKGSTAEAAAKNKALPTGVKFSTCAPDVTAAGIRNPDFLNFSVKYDAGKLAEEIGDVFLVLQDLTETTGTGNRYYLLSRTSGVGGGMSLTGAATATALDALAVAWDADVAVPKTVPGPFLAATDNLGTGAQTEILFGGNLNLLGLDKGLYALSVVIAKPGANYTATLSNSSFRFDRPETWAAHDTAVFSLGTPFGISTAVNTGAVNLTDYTLADSNGLTPDVCQ